MNYFQMIIEEIKNYQPTNQEEKKYRNQIIKFLITNKNNYLRTNPEGHLTASAWIINYNRDKVLLHYHKSLDKWIQLGGHFEKEEMIHKGAFREAREESGLNSLSIIEQNIFDLDVHKIPGVDEQAEHFHYDLRILMEANSEEELEKSNESKSLKWIDLNDAENYISEESILRMLRKTKKF